MPSSSTGYLEARVSLDDAWLRVGAHLAAKELGFQIKGVQLVILFPNFAKVDGKFKPTSDGTRIALRWIESAHHKGKLFGSPSSWMGEGEGRSIITFDFNALIVRSRYRLNSRDARKLKAQLTEWKSYFIGWVEALSYIDIENSTARVEQAANTEAYYVVRGKKARRIKRRNEHAAHITISVRATQSEAILKKAFRLSSSLQGPPDYYTQLLSALKHFNQEMYRQSLLDSATAFEMAETELLSGAMSGLSSQQKKLIENKYRQIRGLWEALHMLQVTVPAWDDVRVNVAEPRNRAIHKGTTVSRSAANDALNFTKTFIYTMLPI